MKLHYKTLGDLIVPQDIRNKDLVTTEVLGVNIDKEFMPSVANTIGTDLSKYKIIKKGFFACNPMHVGRDEKLPIALYYKENPAIVSPAYFVFKVKDDSIIESDYLKLWFLRANFDRECWFHTDGSVRGGITWNNLYRMELPVPTIAEQRIIINIYNLISKKINIIDSINDNLLEQSRLFYRNTFLTSKQDSWSKGYLSDLIEIKYGKDHKKLDSGNIPVYGSGGIMRYANNYLYNKESVLIPRKGTLNNVTYINEPFWTVDTMFYTEMKQENVAKFVYFYLCSKDLSRDDTGSAVPSMTRKTLNAMSLFIPPASVLADFEHKVSANFKMIEILNKENAKLRGLRDNLLRELIS